MIDIWVFSKGQMKIHYSDLHTLKGVAEKLHPEESNGRKTALVVGTGLQQGLASMYSDIGKDLPREIRVFSDLKLAEDWIKQNSVQDPEPSFSVANLELTYRLWLDFGLRSLFRMVKILSLSHRTASFSISLNFESR
jgi:hypothetical protein